MYSRLDLSVTSLFDEERGPLVVVPVIGGVALTDRIDAFERAAGIGVRFKGRRDYGGLIPAYYRFGAAETHFYARDDGVAGESGKVPLLGCACGEVMCWPLEARIEVTRRAVIWTGFRQPYRPEWDYAGFGPFAFRREQYAHAVARIADDWDVGDYGG